MAKIECFDEILKELGEKVSGVDVRSVIKELQRIRSRTKSKDFSSAEFRTRALEFLQNRRLAQINARREYVENLLKAQKRVAFYSQRAFDKDPVEGVMAILTGTSRYSNSGNFSVDRIHKSVSAKIANNLVMGLEKHGLLDAVRTGGLDKQIMQELWEMQPGGRPGVSGSEEAIKAASVLKAAQSQMLEALRKSGANVGEIPGYIMKQSHDRLRVKEAGFEKWYADIKDRLDIDKIEAQRAYGRLDDQESFDEYMREVYNDIVFGRNEKATAEGVADELLTVFGKNENLGRKLAKSRKLHFKSAESFYEYNQMYGRRNLFDSIVASIRQTARSAALMHHFGTNPRASFEADIVRLKKLYADDEKVFQKLNTKIETLRRRFDEVEGVTSVPGQSMMARTGRNLRILQNLTKLGGSVISAVADWQAAASTLKAANGKNLLSNYATVTTEFLGKFPKGQRREVARKLGLFIDDLLGETYSRFGSDDSGPGLLSKSQRIFFKLNGLEFQTSAAKTAIARQLSMELAEESVKTFDQLSKHMQANLKRYGIHADEWNLLQRAVDEDMMVPEKIAEIPEDFFPGGSKQRHELELKLLTYFQDQADMGSPTPGARQRAMLTMGRPEDDWLGQVVRFVAQFKSFPLTVASVAERILLSNPDTMPRNLKEAIVERKGDIWSLTQFIVGTTVLGYIGMSAKDIAAGREPRDPNSVETWNEAMLRGGALGLYGDFLFSEYDKHRGRTLIGQAAGPFFSDLEDGAELFSKAIRGDAKAYEAVKFFQRQIPGQNLFYAKAALDYLIMFRINEALNPGYLRRMEQRAKQDNREFILRPTEAVR